MRFLRLNKPGWAGALVIGAVLTTLFAATPAAMAEPEASTRTEVTGVHASTDIASDDVGVLSYRDECFGYWGTFKDGSRVVWKTWSDGTEECFGIAPDRTIWHAWPNSGGWREMPGNGRADEVYEVHQYASGDRVVEVFVDSSSTFWCNRNPVGSASWGRWYSC
jgi:hypothetical protein